jgi:hypothetical protein
MKIKKIYIFLFLMLWPCLIYCDTVYFYEGFNKLKEINCKVISIDSVFVRTKCVFNNIETDLSIHSSRIYYIKFNNKYKLDKNITVDEDWQELYYVKDNKNKKRIYLKNVNDALRSWYKTFKFAGKDANILIGDILYYNLNDSTIKISSTKLTGVDSIITDWKIVPYLNTWYRE